MTSARQAVQERLKGLGWTTAQLANRVESLGRGVSKPQVYEFIAEKRDVTTRTLDVICEALGIEYVAKSPPIAAPPGKRKLVAIK